jgi:hypothetical protein
MNHAIENLIPGLPKRELNLKAGLTGRFSSALSTF